MGTILDTIISFIIGALVILAILGLNTSLTQTSYDMTSQDNSQDSIEELLAMIKYDFAKIGFGVSHPTLPIITLGNNNITFRSDVDNNGTIEQVRYFMSDSTAVTSTQNPHDCFLYRTINGSEPAGTALGVTDFILTYYDEGGSQTWSPASVRSIEIKIIVQSTFPVDGEYSLSERLIKISPMPLQL